MDKCTIDHSLLAPGAECQRCGLRKAGGPVEGGCISLAFCLVVIATAVSVVVVLWR